ncbi:hypothetical protein J421_0054 [Gemmatirosa kalamazoonensis]|uniref:Uncharacterized protein n=1 Tax=Gemmatirosa kalamazoonensis TaxID=861299 RepID=W0RB79_9BACT|nr:hypothetical protein [Gemmatirosa kalamazoonensis]AHG87547.1 hypothetical protein J421_0009 [Gemmatirosa kalamazoonensis]AHG87570.1 hypothetical protein J421_0032 [Gemmatirosa kalamazoonensis]AHG87591.1 hypothetical protein J421_0054 [Gemmatirosa kalamazoonensis]
MTAPRAVPSIGSADDVLRYMARALEARGEPLGLNARVDFEPLFAAFRAGDLPHFMVHFDNAERAHGWIQHIPGSGLQVQFTPRGFERVGHLVMPARDVEIAARVAADRFAEALAALPAELKALQASETRVGMLHSGRHTLGATRLVEEAAERGFRAALEAWLQVLRRRSIEPSAELVATIVASIGDAFDASEPTLRHPFVSLERLGRLLRAPDAILADAKAKGLAFIQSELSLEAIAPGAPAESHRAPNASLSAGDHNISLVIHGDVGVVQAGAGAQASVTMQPDALDALRDSLEQLRGLLEAQESDAGSEGSTSMVGPIKETVDAAIVESRKPTPNPITMRGLLVGIATAVQTIGAAPQAYELARLAARHFGVELPQLH